MTTPPLRKPVAQDVIDLLLGRRSLSVAFLTDPGPTDAELETILRIATRVPDHGKLAPWRIIVVRGKAQARVGDEWARIFAERTPDAPAELVEFERRRPQRAPLVLAVHTHIVNLEKIPRWEQQLAGANVCLNALIAANALGYFSNWLTEWVAYDDEAKAALGIPPEDDVLGYLYIGSGTTPTEERIRPALGDVVREL